MKNKIVKFANLAIFLGLSSTSFGQSNKINQSNLQIQINNVSEVVPLKVPCNYSYSRETDECFSLILKGVTGTTQEGRTLTLENVVLSKQSKSSYLFWTPSGASRWAAALKVKINNPRKSVMVLPDGNINYHKQYIAAEYKQNKKLLKINLLNVQLKTKKLSNGLSVYSGELNLTVKEPLHTHSFDLEF